jgi:hypothetical protein
VPAGWTVQPEGDPLRLAGFWAGDGKVDVSIVQLEGDAGGLTANVVRWLGQAGLPADLAESILAAAEPVQTATGQRGVVVDFTGHTAADLTQSRSIVGAIVDAGDHTLFVKAMGGKAGLAIVKPQLVAFTRGLSIAAKSDKAAEGGVP